MVLTKLSCKLLADYVGQDLYSLVSAVGAASETEPTEPEDSLRLALPVLLRTNKAYKRVNIVLSPIEVIQVISGIYECNDYILTLLLCL